MSGSNIERAENLKQIVVQTGPKFNQLAKIHGAVHFEREASFALQLLQDNSYLAGIAYNNPDSLRRAIINVAAIGLTLSPVFKFAHLVPRDEKVCLDIGFQGYVKLGTDIGAIVWAVAEVVHANDKYLYKGVDVKPFHEFDPFSDRGVIKGAYCLTKLPGADGYLVAQMPIEEIYKIRDRTAGWRAFKAKGKHTMWNSDETEMIKKTLIRRAWKSWPKTDKSERFDTAMKVLDETDDMVIDAEAVEVVSDEKRTSELAAIHDGLIFLGKEEPKFVEYCARVNKREIKEIHEMTDMEISRAAAYVEQLVHKQKELNSAAS